MSGGEWNFEPASYPSEPFVLDWLRLAVGGEGGVPSRLAEILPQFRAVRFERAVELRLEIHDSGVGLVPVLRTPHRGDFERLVQVLFHRGEPKPVPEAVSAMMIGGVRNAARAELTDLAKKRGILVERGKFASLAKDRVILIQDWRAYSGVSAADLGFEEEIWLERSSVIRLEHELCHYVVRRLFPRHKFGVFDELVADFVGIFEVFGKFEADLFLRLIGLEDFPRYRQGARLEVYVGEGDDFDAVSRSLVEAARKLEAANSDWRGNWPENRVPIIRELTQELG